jgi:thiamine biosynthesis lipoprotein
MAVHLMPIQTQKLRPALPLIIGSWLGLSALLWGCDPGLPAITSSFKALGDAVDVQLVRVAPDQAERAAELIRADFATLDQDLNTWSDGSMARINRLLPTGEVFDAPASVLPLVHLSQRYADLSGGLFNPAIGKLIALWGFNVEVPEGMRPPPDHAIGQLLKANPRMSDVEVVAARLQGHNKALRLDFTPLIRAYAIDLAISRLRALGIDHAQVQCGGDLRAIGNRGGRPWRVPIRRGSGSGVFATLDIEGDESVVTRATHDRDWIYDGVTYHYILDPRSGRPARGVQSVTIVHPDATVAAAAAIAAAVAGPGHWHEVAQRLGVRFALLVDDSGTVHLNPELHQRIEIVDQELEIRLSPPLGEGPRVGVVERGF